VTATDIAIVGVGKIARDQHIPSIGANQAFNLAATVSRSGGVEGVENHETLEALLAGRPDVSAVALCMPPQVRFAAAKAALEAGRHVLLEKPPGATIAEVEALKGKVRVPEERQCDLEIGDGSLYRGARLPETADHGFFDAMRAEG
jgi:D-galactose 1-dehydrogenase